MGGGGWNGHGGGDGSRWNNRGGSGWNGRGGGQNNRGGSGDNGWSGGDDGGREEDVGQRPTCQRKYIFYYLIIIYFINIFYYLNFR